MKPGFIFDMDGVMIDSEPLHLQVETQYFKAIGIDDCEQFLLRYPAVRLMDMLKAAVKEYDLKDSPYRMYDELLAAKLLAFEKSNLVSIDGIRELIEFLSKNDIRTAVASSSAKKLIELILKKLNILECFDICISGDEVKKGKPRPDIFIEASKRIGLAPYQCIVLEDSSFGVLAAKKAGTLCIGFNNPSMGSQDLKQADHIVDKISEVIPFICSRYSACHVFECR